MTNQEATGNTKIPSWLIYTVAMVEGGAVMLIELGGVNLMAPFYGSTLYVWAAVLSVTLGGLATGYFLGGKVARRYSGLLSVPWILLVGAMLVAAMPASAKLIMPITFGTGIRLGSLLSALTIIAPPLILMGMISPVIIQLKVQDVHGAGKEAGTIYAISTLGGIIMTLALGFYLLPELGIMLSIIIVTGLLCLAGITFLLLRKNYRPIPAMILVFCPLLPLSPKNTGEPVQLLYQDDSVMGQLTVYDFIDESGSDARCLLVNGVPQNLMVKKYEPFSAWSYPHRIATIASIKPPGSRALLVGLGAGHLAMELKGLDFKVDAVEIDARMQEVGQRFFGFDQEGVNVTIDDGRHFIAHTNQKYDIVILDVIKGESPAHYMLTIEALGDIKSILTNDGILLLNFQGYLDEDRGLAARSVYLTLEQSGFHVKHHRAMDADSDILFIASKRELYIEQIDESRLNLCCQILAFEPFELVSEDEIDTRDAIVFVDDKPVFNKINLPWTEEWRRRRVEQFALSQNSFSPKPISK